MTTHVFGGKSGAITYNVFLMLAECAFVISGLMLIVNTFGGVLDKANGLPVGSKEGSGEGFFKRDNCVLLILGVITSPFCCIREVK